MNITEEMEDREKDLKQQEIEKDITAMIDHWSRTFELPIAPKLSFPKNTRRDLCYRLIEEELDEFMKAQLKENLDEIQDALGDILWVTIRAMMEYGIDPLKTTRAIYKSNMSKADYTAEDAFVSMDRYIESGIPCRIKKSANGIYSILRNSDDKVLKSHKFVEPIFEN
jgi:NTP pyrophosphatase (non-canonical NTP hydrolase)